MLYAQRSIQILILFHASTLYTYIVYNQLYHWYLVCQRKVTTGQNNMRSAPKSCVY